MFSLTVKRTSMLVRLVEGHSTCSRYKAGGEGMIGSKEDNPQEQLFKTQISNKTV